MNQEELLKMVKSPETEIATLKAENHRLKETLEQFRLTVAFVVGSEVSEKIERISQIMLTNGVHK